jgi:phospholipid/cholesterol/gamma-HCH transport system ATP-binding protein
MQKEVSKNSDNKPSSRELSHERKAVNVSVKNLCKNFGNQPVLKGISFDVREGEICVIMGPSGCGKSVLLKTIIGLEQATSGQVLIENSDASDANTHTQYVTSIVFQSGGLLNSMTVFDNLALYPREHGLYKNKKELEDKVMHVLKILSLEKSADKYPSELSGGMKKRAAIARALVTEPQLLLYDEPTSELDPIMAATIAEVIGTLKEEFHVTSIVVSHDRDLAFSIADRVGILMDGEFRAMDKPERLKELNDKDVQNFLNPRIDIAKPRFRN